MTNTELQTELRELLDRGTTHDARLVPWLNAALKWVCRSKAFAGLRQTDDTKKTAADTRAVTLPTGCGQIDGLWYQLATDQRRRLYPLDDPQAHRMYHQDSTGSPYHYIRRVTDIDIYPLPDAIYDLSLVYFSIFVDLSAGDDTNYLTDEYPWLLIYKAAERAGLHLQDEGIVGAARAGFAEEYAAAYAHEIRRATEPIREIPVSTSLTAPKYPDSTPYNQWQDEPWSV